MISFNTIFALVSRYLYLYTRNWVRFIELLFWPITDLLVWGFLTTYLLRQSNPDLPGMVTFLIGAMIFWDVLFRAQQGVAISFLEDVWTRNLLNIFVAPVRVHEYLMATFAVGFLRILLTLTVLATVSYIFYAFNLLDLQWGLLPFIGNLLLFGWSLGMISTALILRYGQAAEALAWAVPFLIQPVSAVFYPLSVLPAWIQPIALAFPSTHVFEGMRHVLLHNEVPWNHVAWAFILNLFYLALAASVFLWILSRVRQHGTLTKFATN